MANREFTVKARIVSDTKDAERNTRALTKAQEELGQKLTDLKAKFDAGEISATKFAKAQAAIERETARVKRTLDGIAPEVDKTTSAFDRQLKALLGFGSATAVFASLKRGITAIAQNMTVSQEATDRAADAWSRFKTAAADAIVEGEASTNAVAGSLDRLATKAETTGDKIKRAMELAKEFIPGMRAASDALGAAFGVTGEVADASLAKLEKLALAWDNNGERAAGFQFTLDGLRALVDATGESLDETSVSAAAQADAIEVLNRAYDAGLIPTSEKYQEILKAIETGMKSQTVVTEELGEATLAASESTVVWNDYLGKWIDTAQVVNTEVGKMIRNFRDVRSDALLAAGAIDELTSAGRRQQLVGGGSQLANAPGLTGFVGRSSGLGRQPLRPRKLSDPDYR